MRILQNFWKIRKLHSEHTYTVKQNKQRKSTSRHIIIIKNIKCREKNLKVSKEKHSLHFSCSVMSDSLQPHGLQHARYPCPSPIPGVGGIYPNSCPLSHVHWVHDAMQPSHPLSSPSTSAFNLFQHQGLFQWVSSLSQLQLRSFSFSISPSNEYSGLISFRMDWLDILAVQGTLKSFIQHHSSKASNLQHSAFFIVQLSHPYITPGKTIALIRWTFVDKIMSLFLICCLDWS